MTSKPSPLTTQIDQLTELVINRFSTLDQRLRGLEDDAAELRGLLKAVVTGIERLNARVTSEYEDQIFDTEDQDDGFLTPPPGQFLH
ncbi:MAG: hypothetical protein WCO00_18135 [Rhodospirillaceae bacterium]